MEDKEEDVRLGANKFSERQPIGTAAQSEDSKDYSDPPDAPLLKPGELSSGSFYRAGMAEFMATFLVLYVTLLTVTGVLRSPLHHRWDTWIAWDFGGIIFALVYCTDGISGGYVWFVPWEEAVIDESVVLHDHAVLGCNMWRGGS